MSDSIVEVAQELFDACKAQHDAIDRLFAELIRRDETFFPSRAVALGCDRMRAWRTTDNWQRFFLGRVPLWWRGHWI